MPFVSEYRSTGSLIHSGSYGPGSGMNGASIRMDTTTGLEAVYSFRTGKRTKVGETATVKTDPLSEVYSPPKGLADALAYRKKFIERSITSVLTNQPGAPTHFLLGDMGHEFGSFKATYTCSPNRVRTNSGNEFTNVRPRYWYEVGAGGTGVAGNLPNVSDDFNFFEGKGFPLFTSRTGPTMSAHKAVASNHISEMNPFRPHASILTTLLELARGDIPGILTSLRRHLITITGLQKSGIKDVAQTLGDEFLSNQFSWAPIVRDIDRAMRLLLELDNLIFKSDSTRRVVRRVVAQSGAQSYRYESLVMHHGFYDTPPESPTWYNSVVKNGANPGGGAELAIVNWSALYTYSVNTSARFNVGLHPTPTNNGHLDRAIDLLGLELTPAVIWELTPWSWLIDWFLHIGTLIQNLSTLGLSNTILQYAYSTGRVERHITGNGTPYVYSGTPNGLLSGTEKMYWTWKTDTKVRIAASPFGFDVGFASLNAGQLAILSALGLARSR